MEAAAATPLHRRTVTYEAFAEAEAVRVVGTLVDRRPWADNSELAGPEVVHEMQLAVVVHAGEQVITHAEARMSAFPHAECPAITPSFEQLVGLRIGAGFTRAVNERFAGAKGCSHLLEVARGLGPAVVQAFISRTALARLQSGAVQSKPSPGVNGTCHIWAAGGIGEQKFAAGWRIRGGRAQAYPVPPLEYFVRARAAEPDADS